MRHRVLVTGQISEEGLKVLRSDPDLELVVRPGLKGEELLREIASADAIVTRSETAVGKELMEAAPRLKVIGRAGVGVDNIDLQEASRRGIVVVNAPMGNTIAAVELTMALMLSLLRKVPWARESVLKGEWDRKRFMGVQLYGKTLMVVGLGRIGSRVAARARAFGMNVLAYDPYVKRDKAESVGARLVDDLLLGLSQADVLTVHTPLTAETRGMIGRRELRAMKRGSFVVNCARGGVIDELALVEAIKAGHIAGAALDVYCEEPLPLDSPLRDPEVAEKVLFTPHIGANTFEAQDMVAVICCKNVLHALKGLPCENAVNLPFCEESLSERERAFLRLARAMGHIGAGLLEGRLQRIRVSMKGPLFAEEDVAPSFEMPYRYRSYTVAALKGAMEVFGGPEVSLMSAPVLAEERGLSVEELTEERGSVFVNTLEISLMAEREELSVVGTVTEDMRERVISIGGYYIEFVPKGHLLFFLNRDRPGVIGRVGTLMGDNDINIANFALGRKNGGGLAMAVVQLDSPLPRALVEKISAMDDIIWARQVEL